MVNRQLSTSGLVSAVHASRAGYADHLTPAQLTSQVLLGHAGASACNGRCMLGAGRAYVGVSV